MINRLFIYMYRIFCFLRKRMIYRFYRESYTIIQDPIHVYPVVNNIKEESWERLYVSEVFKISKEYSIECYSGAQYVLTVDDARVSSQSDIVVTSKGVLWDKYYKSSFTKTIPLDSNLISFSIGQVDVVKAKKQISVDGAVISMGGVHSNVWAHFLVMYLPRLYYAAELGLLDNSVTVLLPQYWDGHIRQIVYDFLSGYTNVSIVEMEDSIDYLCQSLFYIPSFSNATDHSSYCMAIDFLIPQNVVDMLSKYLVERYSSIAHKDKHKKKLYLARRGGYRCATNWQEIEDFFRNEGFEIIEPHKLTLVEKVAAFKNANVIVGPYSAAFTNLLFCKDAKVLIISPLMRSVETYYYTIAQKTSVRILNVTGVDKGMNIHTNYFVPVEKIKEAYEVLINN